MIRPAKAEDLPAVQALWREWWGEYPFPYHDFDTVMERQARLLLRVIRGEQRGVALVTDDLQGVLLWAGEDDSLHGFGVYLAQALRGKGTGNQLLAAGFQAAKAAGFTRVFVAPYWDNTPSHRWLERAGFSPVQLLMVREL